MTRLALPLVLALALAGCTSDRPQPKATTDPVATRLTEVARQAGSVVFAATYSFTEASSGRGGVLKIWQRPPDYRLDIEVGGTTASYLVSAAGVVSCTTKPKTAPDCFLVARPGEPVPELFDPGFQRLFQDAVAALAANPADYSVRAASPRPATSGVPAAECFEVSRLRTPSPTPGGPAPGGFETGEYCFAANGVPVRFAVKSGTVSLTSTSPAPVDRDFVPPARPKTLPPLPSGSASPSAS